MKTLKNKAVTAVTVLVWSLCASFIMTTGQLTAVTEQIGIDGLGNMVAVWEVSEGDAVTIQAATCMAGSNTWSSPQQLSWSSGSVNYNSFAGRVVTNSAGQTVAVWVSTMPDSSVNQVYAATISLQGSATWTNGVAVSPASQPVRKWVAGSCPYSLELQGTGKAVISWNTTESALMSSASTITDGTNSWTTPAVVYSVSK